MAEYGTCYRYKQSGELFGLVRLCSLQKQFTALDELVA